MTVEKHLAEFDAITKKLLDENLILGSGVSTGKNGLLAGVMTPGENRVRVAITRTGLFMNRRKMRDPENDLRAAITAADKDTNE